MMAWLEGWAENWTNAVHMTEGRLERQLDGGAAPSRETVRRVLESVNQQWLDPNHFYGVWLCDFGTAHPDAGRKFAEILTEMAHTVAPTYRAPTPLLPIGGGLVAGAAGCALLGALAPGPAVRATAAVAIGAATAFALLKMTRGGRRQVREQIVGQVSRELSRYGERLRILVAQADSAETAAK